MLLQFMMVFLAPFLSLQCSELVELELEPELDLELKLELDVRTDGAIRLECFDLPAQGQVV